MSQQRPTFSCLCFFAALLGYLAIDKSAFSQDLPKPSGSNVENWVGWIESPQEHLRWILRLTKDSKTGRISGTSSTPDRTLETIPLSNIRLQPEDWGFDWVNAASNQTFKFAGTMESANQVTGLLLVGAETIVIRLHKAVEISAEDTYTLGADTVYTDNVPVVGTKHKFDMRFRIYSTPPYTEGKPKILFDSLKAGVLGKPVELAPEADSSVVFKVPSIQSEYRATLDEQKGILLGTFSRNGNIIPLSMTKWETHNSQTSPSDSKKPMVDPAMTKSVESIPQKEDASVKIKINEQPDRKFLSNEQAVTVTVGGSALQTTNEQTSKISGTLTMPTFDKKPASEKSKAPVVIFASTYGPQDRDGMLGTNAQYRDIAQSLSKLGIASIRVDDRGMGSSEEPIGDFTLSDAETDLRAIVQFAASKEGLDADRIGLLGHGEGAIAATAVAATDNRIQFLLLLAPPGLSGSELLLAQSARVSGLQGMGEKEQWTMMELQRGLHRIAATPQSEDFVPQEAVRRLVDSKWSDLERTLPTAKTQRERADIRRNIEQQLLADLMELKKPSSRQFLNMDPAKTWMLLRCPTLAIWGSKDLEVVADANRKSLQAATARNSKANVRWQELPDLNHWFQRAKTGSPEEYETLGGIDPTLVETIRVWLSERW